MNQLTFAPLIYLDIGEIVREDDTDVTIATLEHGPGWDGFQEGEAYGELLAAAPEMLVALRNARVILQSFRVSGEGGLDTMIADIDAAIAKAEGK